jgi:hypothetical protein
MELDYYGLKLACVYSISHNSHNSHSPSTKIPFQRNIHYACNFGA